MEKLAKLAVISLSLVVFLAISASVAFAQYTPTSKLKKAIGESNQYDVKAAILSGAQANTRDQHGVPFICLAARKGDSGVVYILLDNGGANPDMAGRDGKTALIIATENGDTDTVKVLLHFKADVNEQDRNGETALIKAARLGERDIVDLLIEAKADLNHQDYTGKTALGYANDNRKMRVANDLKKAGATE